MSIKAFRIIKAYLAKKAAEWYELSPEEQKREYTKLTLQQEKMLKNLDTALTGPKRLNIVRDQLAKAKRLDELRDIAEGRSRAGYFLNEVRATFDDRFGLNPRDLRDIALAYLERSRDSFSEVKQLVEMKVLLPEEVRPLVLELIEKNRALIPHAVDLGVISESMGYKLQQQHIQKMEKDFEYEDGAELLDLLKGGSITPEKARPLAKAYIQSNHIFDEMPKLPILVENGVFTKEELSKLVAENFARFVRPPVSSTRLVAIKIAENLGYVPKGYFRDSILQGADLDFSQVVALWGGGALSPEEYWGYIEASLKKAKPDEVVNLLRWALMRYPDDDREEKFWSLLKEKLRPFYTKNVKLKNQLKKDSVTGRLVD
jgi:hypothetical protein